MILVADKQGTKLSPGRWRSRGRGRRQRVRFAEWKVSISLFKWVLRNACASLRSWDWQTDRRTAAQCLRRLSWVSTKLATTAIAITIATPTSNCVCYRYVVYLSLLFVVVCCSAGRTKWPKGCSPGSRRRILHSGPLQSNDESSNFYKN